MNKQITVTALEAMLTWYKILNNDYDDSKWVELGKAYDRCCELGFEYPGDTLRELGIIE